MPHRHLPRRPVSDFRWISLLEVLSRMETNLDRLMQSKQHHTSVASSIIHRRVMIRSEPSSLMANYSKIKRVEPPWSHLAIAVEGNWNTEEWEDIEEVKRRTEKLRRKVVERLDEGNVLESKTAQDCHLCLWPVKRLEVRLSCKEGFLE